MQIERLSQAFDGDNRGQNTVVSNIRENCVLTPFRTLTPFRAVIDIKEDKWLVYLACPYLTQITDQSVWPFDPDTYTVGIGSSASIP